MSKEKEGRRTMSSGRWLWPEQLVFRIAKGLGACVWFAHMAHVKRLLHTRYRVDDLEKTVAFYRDVLGLEEVRRHKSPRGSELVFFKAPGSEEEIEICYFPESGPVKVQPDLTHLAFEVEDLERFREHIRGRGYDFSDGPEFKENGGGFAFIDAPEGYEIELVQRPAAALGS